MGVIETFDVFVTSLITFLPNLIAAIIILIIAWIVGRVLGKVASRALDKVGVDDALRKTIIGKSIESSGTSIPHVFDLIVRWFIYIIGIMSAVNVLGILILSSFTEKVVSYIPNFIAALIVVVVGFILADILSNLIKKTGTESEAPYMGIFSLAIQIFLYFIVIVIALDQLRINTSIIFVFANALAWGIALGVGVGLGIAFGYGLKDKVPPLLESLTGERAKQTLDKIEKQIESQPEAVETPSSGAVPA
ncbi:MAG TPA: hypothetical protein VJJ51_02355 [Candidatus Methanoperedens sp.]|nr:hypothetical protein [Candidatus Methanoperedens sp.]HLB69866.1 hypothetical protein [Candidatus Methanoperedens sp.]